MMKIIINCEKFSFGGNNYKKGDILDVGKTVGNMLVQRHNGLSTNLNPVIKESKPVKEKKEVKEEKKKEEKKNINSLDLNGDGVFDKKDKSLAAKVLATKTKPTKSKKGKKK